VIYDKYEQYERRMRTLAKIVAWIRRYYKTVILPPVIAICAVLAFLSAIGIFTERPEPPSLVYGEMMDLSADAFLSDVSYEFRTTDGTVWHEGVPDTAGTYVLRAISRNGFGKPYYSDEATVVISPAPLSLECTLDACLYGTENETVSQSIRAVGLMGGDRLADGVFTVLSYSETGVNVKVESFRILGEDGSDRTFCYETEPFQGFVTLQPRQLTLATETKEKAYDGTPLSGGTFRIAEGTLAAGDALDVSDAVTATRVGKVENRPEVKVVSQDGRDVTGFYDIAFQYGTLTVLPRSITVATADGGRIYDGTPLTAEDIRVSVGSLAEGDALVPTACPSLTKVGTLENQRTVTVMSRDGKDVTDQYAIQYRYGTLEILPRPITVATAAAERVYDGTPLVGTEPQITEGTLVEGEALRASAPKSILYVGSVADERVFTVIGRDGADVTDQYDITAQFGILSILPRSLALYTESAEKIYDGEALLHDAIKIRSGTLAEGDTMQASSPVSATAVGTVENKREVTLVNRDGRDVTEQYDISWEFGTLTVQPRPLTLVTGSAEKIYDGTALRCPDYRIQEGSLAPRETLSPTSKPSITEVGKRENDITFSIKNAAGEETSANYAMTFEYGTLEVKPIVITYRTEGAEKVYDAKPLTNPRFTLVSGKVLSGHTLSKAYTTGTRTDAGSSPNTMEVIIKDKTGRDVTNLYYRIEVEEGMLVVKPKEITLTSGSAEKVYDGKPLTNSKISLSKGSVLSEHIRGHKRTGSQTNPGSSPNYFTTTIKDKATGEDVTRNYNIIYNYGTLTVHHANSHGSGEGECNCGESGESGGGGGGGGGGGVGPSDPNRSPINDGPMQDRDDSVIAKLNTFRSKTEMVYLRECSYGNYDFRSWGAAPVCDLAFSHNPFFFSGTQAELVKAKSYGSLRLTLMDNSPYLAPYYLSYSYAENSGLFSDNDVTLFAADNTAREYSFSRVFHDITLQELQATTTAPAQWTQKEEAAYRAFVYKNYLDIPQSTKDAMLRIAAENGIHKQSKSLITDIQRYISTAATYNLDIPQFPEGVDMAVYFLEEMKEGYCQHFATAGTLMYRAFGIPARYTVGYAPTVQGSVSMTDVTGLDAHAWVEIYLDGIGWIPVEVTAAGQDREVQVGGQTVIVDVNGKIKITVSTFSQQKYYDGRPFDQYKGDLYWISEGTLLDGHRIEVEVRTPDVGLKDAGHGMYNQVTSVKILDVNGENVADQYKISYDIGDSQIDRRPLTIRSQSATAVYDGTSLQATDWWIVSGSLMEGNTIEVTVTGKRDRIGTSSNTFNVVIKDAYGTDVTKNYTFKKELGRLTLTAR